MSRPGILIAIKIHVPERGRKARRVYERLGAVGRELMAFDGDVDVSHLVDVAENLEAMMQILRRARACGRRRKRGGDGV